MVRKLSTTKTHVNSTFKSYTECGGLHDLDPHDTNLDDLEVFKDDLSDDFEVSHKPHLVTLAPLNLTGLHPARHTKFKVKVTGSHGCPASMNTG